MAQVEFYTPEYGWGHGIRLAWVPSANGQCPPNAVDAGHDNGARVVVARANFNGLLIPGKLHLGHQACYVPYNGIEQAVHSYEVLVAPPGMLRWVPSSGGQKIPNAVIAGRSETGEPYFVGRCYYEGTLTAGKVHPSHGVCYIPYGGREIGQHNYEILVR